MPSRLLILILFIACSDLAPWRDAGEPCDHDEQCYGLCWDGRCHLLEFPPCDPKESPSESPCLRPRRAGEGECREVRVGRLRCSVKGQSLCEPLERYWRETPDGCDEDQDGEVDEKLKGCSGLRVRGEFSTNVQNPSFMVDDAQSVSYGRAGVQGVLPVNACQPLQAQWSKLGNSSAPIDEHLSWTWMSDCPTPPSGEDPQAYQGRWIRWHLPQLSRRDNLSIKITLRDHLFSSRSCIGQFQLPEFIEVYLQPLDDLEAPPQTERLKVDLDDGSLVHAWWDCVELPKGRANLYLYDHLPGGCRCEEEECQGDTALIPVGLSLWR